jgi:hypothetical protein
MVLLGSESHALRLPRSQLLDQEGHECISSITILAEIFIVYQDPQAKHASFKLVAVPTSPHHRISLPNYHIQQFDKKPSIIAIKSRKVKESRHVLLALEQPGAKSLSAP